ncbi:uncharacterized protein C8R40DRAFT_1114176 [Lentinula edodes]|uniref:uncharacterized protein n=1 Tax=Lentinula edodes TaxID=5353 RepID=UPI001E8DC7CB|nr:uncharacterized protein C8R40DRAFT_1114176 [Lentinula edodes]KAH7873166.1 hypothetical protein C8R40DRAFT_1114176 [Lentinula edodes]
MLSRACHRCKGTTHGPEKHLLTCQNCHKSWHDCTRLCSIFKLANSFCDCADIPQVVIYLLSKT